MVSIRTYYSNLRGKYPGQFWLMFIGMLISTVGTSMVWPFMMIYITRHLGLSLTLAASLMSLNAFIGVAASFIAGPIVDRVGRKGMLVFSLFGNGMVYFLYSQASGVWGIGALMVLSGIFNPIYRLSSDAMMADLIPEAKRPDAYALMRMAHNLGIAVGPAIGGVVAVTSYAIAFSSAAVGLCIFGLLLLFFARESMPLRLPGSPIPPREVLGGYGRVLQDRNFLIFNLAVVLMTICASLIWILMPVHANTLYGIREDHYGLLPMTNALLVVFLQVLVTNQTKKYKPLTVLALGSLVYGGAVSSVALARDFWGFWISMVLMTIGEMVLVPTATTFAANQAPADMRGRYMSIYSLTWPAASGSGPLIGGMLNDNVGPFAPWLAGGVSGVMASLAFASLSKRVKRQQHPALEAEELPAHSE
jgi:MFS family permease